MILRVFCLIMSLLWAALPAQAHRLKVFATVDGANVTGYAFFVGADRARGTDWVATDVAGNVIADGQTDDDGVYLFPAPVMSVAPVTISVDTHEGHMARAVLPASRFSPVSPAAAPDDVSMMVEAAVARQITPLAGQIEALQDRLRYADILSALFLIAGVAGVGLWLRDRLR